MKKVVDASIVIKWYIPEENSDASVELLRKWLQEGDEIIVPELLFYEVTSVLRKTVMREVIPHKEAEAIIEHLCSLRLSTRSGNETLHKDALRLAQTYHCSTAYDTSYLALAIREGCEYWTADERFYNTIKGKLPRINLLA